MSLADELRAILEQEERWELIYEKINGEYVMDFCTEVRDEMSGGEIGPLIQQFYLARNRIAARLGLDPALDRDFTQLTDAMERYARTCGKLMYRYTRTARPENRRPSPECIPGEGHFYL